MANQESTAIHDLIRLVQGGKRPDRESENPVELFVPANRPAVRLQETLDEASGDIPSLGRHRAPSGTPAPSYTVPSVATPAYLMPQGATPALPTPIAQGTPAQAYRVPTHAVEQDDEQTELWQGTPQVAPIVASIPAIAPAISMHAMPVAPRMVTSHLPREMSPLVRYAGLGLLAVAAISIGTYLGASGGGSDQPNERDRAIAIMSGEIPAPAPSTHVTAPTTPTVRIEAVAAPAPVEPAKDPVIWAAPVVIDSAEIEMEAETRKPAARRVAIAKPQPKPAIVETKPAKQDQIQKLLAEKPKAEKPKAEKLAKAEKPKKGEKALVATEITAPKGAAATGGSGQVSITSNRPAVIYLDGRPTGKTTPSALVIPAGDHQITLLDPGTKKAKTATVKIAANKSVTISREFN